MPWSFTLRPVSPSRRWGARSQQTQGREPTRLLYARCSPEAFRAAQGAGSQGVVGQTAGMAPPPSLRTVSSLPPSGALARWARRCTPAESAGAGSAACRPVKGTGEPCAGEPHARFDVAGAGDARCYGCGVGHHRETGLDHRRHRLRHVPRQPLTPRLVRPEDSGDGVWPVPRGKRETHGTGRSARQLPRRGTGRASAPLRMARLLVQPSVATSTRSPTPALALRRSRRTGRARSTAGTPRRGPAATSTRTRTKSV